MQIVAVFVVCKFRKRIDSPPTLVLELALIGLWVVKLFDHVPVYVWRILLFLYDVLKRKKVATGVIKHAIDDDSDVSGVGFV